MAPGGYAAGGECVLARLEWCPVGEASPDIREVGVGDIVDVIEDVV